MKRLLTLFIVIPLVALLFCNFTVAVNSNQTYTFDEDFDNGTMAGLEHETTHNQLQISNPPATIPFIWVPNSNEGTVSKVDTRTGKELGRYRVSPFSYSSPSRTTVDLQGNCWVANRQTGTAVKIGLYENGGYIDRNLNGIIETSMDLNDDGIIDGDELLPWGLDECVLYDIILIPGREGTYIPGQYTEGYANDSSNPGPRGVAVDAQNNIWVGTYATMKFYYINGSNGQIIKVIDVSSVNHKSYGAIIDENGVIWSSGHDGNNVLRLNPEDNSFFKINIPHFVYGLGIDRQNHLFVSGWTDSKLTRINTLTGAIEWTISCPIQSRGITVTDDGDVWVANSQAGTVSRYSNDGILKATINVGNNPTGLSMDADGKVWVVNYGDEYIHRINPATNSIELSKRIHGGLHYGYSDMTGAVSRTITTKLGTWTVIHDSEVNNVSWGIVSWNSFVPTGTDLNVKVRSSNDKINWSTWEEVQNGVLLGSKLPGRYLQVLVTFQIISGQTSPILYDLSVKANVADISIKIADSQDPVLNGEKLNYAVLVSNNGPSNAENVKLTGIIPLQDIIYSLNKGSTWELWKGSLNLENITSGNSTLMLFSGKVPHTASSVLNCTLAINSDTIDGNISNNIDSELTAITTRYEVNQNLKNDGNGNVNGCGPKSLVNVLSKLGIDANPDYIALIAGTTNTGTSFYGLVQAAKLFGLNLTGLKLDANNLKPFDIVLLNFNGTGHYSIILSISGNWVVLSDPTLGIVTISKDDFLKLYSGYALTFNHDGRGMTLNNETMKTLKGSSGLEELYTTWLAMEVGSLEVPGAGWLLATILLVFGIVFFGGNYLLNTYAPNLIPNKGTGWKGLGIDLFNTLSPVVKLNQDGTYYTEFQLPNLINWAAYRKPRNPYKSPIFSDPNEGKNFGTFAGKLWIKCDELPIPLNYGCKGSTLLIAGTAILSATLLKLGFTLDKIIDSVFNIPNKISEWMNEGSNNTSNSSNLFNITFNNTSKITTSNSGLMMVSIPGLINRDISAENAVKTAASTMVSAIKTGVEKAVTAVKQVAIKVVNTAKKIVNKTVTVAKKAVKTVKEVVKKVSKTVKKAVKKTVKTVKKVVNTVKNVVSSGWNWLKGKIGW